MSLNNGVQAVWAFEDVWTDGSGNGRTLTPNGGPAFSSTRKLGSKSSLYDGINDRAITSSPSYQPNGDISVFMWVRPTTQLAGGSVYRPVMTNCTINGTGFMIMAYRENNTGFLALVFDYDNGNTPYYSWGSLGVDTFHLVGFTWEESSETLVTYANNNRVVRSVAAGTLNVADNNIHLASSPDLSLNRFFKGHIDDTVIWNRALTQAEATTIWNGGAGLQYPYSEGIPIFRRRMEGF